MLASQKAGHTAMALGLARALGVAPDIRLTAPRPFFRALAPWGPSDPALARAGGPVAPPFPDIAIASARETVPALAALKRASGGRVFAIYLGDPRSRRDAFDLIWVPEHDRLRGDHVIATLTAPHAHDAAARAARRADPDPRLAALPGPRVAMLIGGPSGRHRFEAGDIAALASIATTALTSGASLVVTPSRRTPGEAMAAILAAAQAADPAGGRRFVWDGAGDNPYGAMLALADAFVVTADSVNMMGEAAATGRPVHVYEPSGEAGKTGRYLEALIAAGAARRWRGALEDWSYAPIDASAAIAAEAARRYAAFRRS